jgi:short-subunit dehydrogenase
MSPPIDSGTVLITGACGELGRQIARQLSRRARTLVLVAPAVAPLEVLREELEALNPTLGVVLLPCDVSQPSQVDAVLEELARHLITVDVLVNAAAVGEPGLFARHRWTDIDRMLQVNVVAPLLLIHRLLGSMLARRRGGILHIGSGAGRLFLAGAATPVGTHRCMDGFLESLRLEVEGTGVTITQALSGPLDEEEVTEVRPGPRPFFQISAAQCAREALAGFERRAPLVYPGLGHHWMMTLLPLLPRMVRRMLGRLAARSPQRPLLPPAPKQGLGALGGTEPSPA